MSHLSKLKTKWGYERSVPRCETCVQYRKPGLYLRDSLPRTTPPQCKAGAFEVKATGCCDRWQSKTGERLENAK